MSEKLDLFEMSIKRGLEKYELPMESNAWDNFKGHLSTGGSSSTGNGSFLPKFGVAAAVITAVGLFVNYGSMHESHMVTHGADHIEHVVRTESAQDTKDVQSSETYLADEHAATSPSTPVTTPPLSVGDSHTDRIVKINDKLQKAADKAEIEKIDLELKTTTRYVGKGFNLGASSEFSPNGDGQNDTFLPSSLEKGDLFLMTVSTTEGKAVFLSDNIEKPWNGMDLAGNPVSPGHYSWEVILSKDNNKEIFRGVVRLDR